MTQHTTAPSAHDRSGGELRPRRVRRLVSLAAGVALVAGVCVGGATGVAGAATVTGQSVCDSMRLAAAGATVVVPAGVWNIGDCRIDGSVRAGVTVKPQYPAAQYPSGPASTLVGMLQCTTCNNWRFDGLQVVGGTPAADPAYVVRMAGGKGWAWTACDISNGVSATGVRYGVRGLFTTINQVRDWRLEGCRIHDNGTSRPTVADNNYDHLVYLNGYKSTTSSNGQVIGNTFWGNRWGSPVKIGYGLDGGVPVGIPGVTFATNTMYNNSSPDGLCGVLVAGNSPWTTVSGNTIDCTTLPVESTRSAIAVRSWVSGARVTMNGNTITGAHNAGMVTGCGTAVSGAYDNAITVQSQTPVQGSWQVNVGNCWWNGINSTSNTSR